MALLESPHQLEVVAEARGIVKSFREGRESFQVLKGVSVAVHRGEIVALEGPSGSGKTTLLSILGCILRPTEGEVWIAGEHVTASSKLPEIRKHAIGFVFQQYNLFPALTARENVEFALNVKGTRGKTARREAEHALDLVGLTDRLSFLPRDLSGGQKQRVAIARALAGAPPVLLADEPTANLDLENGAQILELFRALVKRENRALLVVTHDPEVRRIADRVLEIRDGRLNQPA